MNSTEQTQPTADGGKNQGTNSVFTAGNPLDVHLAEYTALTSRCTNWLGFQVPIWGALIAFLGIIFYLWESHNHLMLILAGGLGVQLLILVWFQTIEEQYRAISYIEDKLRPRVQLLIGTSDFWDYEAASAGRDDLLNWWGEWLSPCVTFVFLVLVCALRTPTTNEGVALLILNGCALVLQFLKSWVRFRYRRKVAAPTRKA